MLKLVKKKLKEQRGMTLIELLAVIVILGIISAIAIPSILGLINNSKKDAFVADGRQMINSAKLAVSGDNSLQPSSGSIYVDLKYLTDKGYLDTMSDPYSGKSFTPGTGTTSTKSSDMTGSYVQISASGTQLTYSVYLTDGSETIALTPESSLSRSSVTP